jgi:hypothetical protein
MRVYCARALAEGRLATGWVAFLLVFCCSPVGKAAENTFYPAGHNWFAEPQPISLASATFVDPIDCNTPIEQQPPEYGPPACANCATYAPCDCCCDLAPVCQDCPNHGLYAFVGNDAWRGLPDGAFGAANWGLSTGVNYGTRLGALSDATGIGGQIGGSFGVYDWLGGSQIGNPNEAQTQGFFTYGLFRKADEFSPWSAAVVQDWMVNNNYGQQGSSPTLSQIRAQIGYAVNAWNEVGFWGAWRVLDDERFPLGPPIGTVWRSVDQYNAYWHHKWGEGGPDTWVWLGLPESNRLTGPGSLGDFIIGWLGEAPLTDRISLFGTVTYMHPSSGPGAQGVAEQTWNVSFGVVFYPGFNARSRTVAGRCWMPQLPVANNGTFLVDEGGRF